MNHEAYKRAIVSEYIIAKILYDSYNTNIKNKTDKNIFVKVYHNNAYDQFDIDLRLSIFHNTNIIYNMYIECKLIEGNNNLCIYPKTPSGKSVNQIVKYIDKHKNDKNTDIIFSNIKLVDNKLCLAYLNGKDSKLKEIIKKINDPTYWQIRTTSYGKEFEIIILNENDFDNVIIYDDSYNIEYNTHYNAIKNYNISQKHLVDSYIESLFKYLN
jgi:hypothetical protein